MSSLETNTAMFSESQRVVYSRNPLHEVICQLQFPPILKIVGTSPFEFQEAIRAKFPSLQERFQDEVEAPAGVPAAVLEMLRSLAKRRVIGYDFTSEDNRWKVVLTRDFLAISTGDYSRWEEFREQLTLPLQALIQVYSPSSFSRVGLRYQNLIRRSALGLPADVNWSELIRSHVSGLLATQHRDAVTEYQASAEIGLPDQEAKVRMISGLARLGVPSNEQCFVIDNDFYTERKTNASDVDSTLRYFNEQSGRLFRWCIQDKLHAIMEPKPVSSVSPFGS